MSGFGLRRVATPWTLAAWAVVGALAVATMALVFGLIGAAIGVQLDSVGAAIIWRGLLASISLIIAARLVYTVGSRLGVTNPVAGTFVACVAGFAVNPLTWSGRTLFAQLAVEPGIISAALDLALWVLVSGVGIHRAATSQQTPTSNGSKASPGGGPSIGTISDRR